MACNGRPLLPEAPAIDSDRCTVAYAVRSVEDVPADFYVPMCDLAFHAGIFLPHEGRDWFVRSPQPARMVLLKTDRLVVLIHRKSETRVVRIKLRDLLFFEEGRVSSRRWIRFVQKGFELRLPYNARWEPIVEEFLRVLREVFLPATTGEAGLLCVFGETPDLKYQNAEHLELASGEHVLFRFFSGATKEIVIRWIFPSESWTASDLLTVTNRRVLWITDRLEGRYDFYAAIARSAPVEALSNVGVESTGESPFLRIEFMNGASWSVPLLLGRHCDARRFADSIAKFRGGKSGFKIPGRGTGATAVPAWPGN